MTDPNTETPPDLTCKSVVWRVAKFPDWIDKDRTHLTPRAFRRLEARNDLPAERGISVVPEWTCTPEEAVQNAKGGVGIGTLLVGHIVDLGLVVDRDRMTHAFIMGMPLKNDPGNEGDALGKHLRLQLASRSRVLDWTPEH